MPLILIFSLALKDLLPAKSMPKRESKGVCFTTDQMPWMAFAERPREGLEACREVVPLYDRHGELQILLMH
ncbi:hypothetical protein GU3_03740 [Oceanimonas sp. GK1]|jgi:hypothetical protein|nr:hypothetical protein GU3_03740 [Oceanimonas sp. GK1]